jgi:hypothetical protein
MFRLSDIEQRQIATWISVTIIVTLNGHTIRGFEEPLVKMRPSLQRGAFLLQVQKSARRSRAYLVPGVLLDTGEYVNMTMLQR